MAHVVDFVTPALRDPDGVAAVVATPDHRMGIRAALRDAGFDPASGRFVLLDVDAVLDSVMKGGAADRDRFRATMGGALDEHLDVGSRVRVYAELAGRLRERSQVTTAMLVEELADEFARDRSFVLLCCYPTELFGHQDPDVGALQTVCDAHTGIIHGDLFRSDPQAGRAHLGEAIQQEAVARALDHLAVRRERDALRDALQDAADQAQARQEQFRDAISSRDVIGQAKGILMVHWRVDADTAFAMLRDAAGRSRRKLHSVAQAVVDDQLRRS